MPPLSVQQDRVRGLPVRQARFIHGGWQEWTIAVALACLAAGAIPREATAYPWLVPLGLAGALQLTLLLGLHPFATTVQLRLWWTRRRAAVLAVWWWSVTLALAGLTCDVLQQLCREYHFADSLVEQAVRASGRGLWHDLEYSQEFLAECSRNLQWCAWGAGLLALPYFLILRWPFLRRSPAAGSAAAAQRCLGRRHKASR
jgi:hypothetical protein